MLKTDNPLLLVPFRFGGIGLLFNITAIVVLYLIGRHPLLLNPVLDARIPLYALIIFASFKTFKDNYNQGIMHFWQGLAMGIVAYLLMAIGTSIFIYIFSAIESSNFLAEYIRIATGQLEANKEVFIEQIGEKTYEGTLAQLPTTRPVHLAFDYLLKSTPIGLFLTLLLAILMRKKISN
jgi:putative flippase GtrA